MRAVRTRMIGIAVCMGALLVGCGSNDPQPAPQSPATAEHGSLAQCLTEHGVTETAVSPAGPPAGVDPDSWAKAMQECSSFAPGPAGP